MTRKSTGYESTKALYQPKKVAKAKTPSRASSGGPERLNISEYSEKWPRETKVSRLRACVALLSIYDILTDGQKHVMRLKIDKKFGAHCTCGYAGKKEGVRLSTCGRCGNKLPPIAAMMKASKV